MLISQTLLQDVKRNIIKYEHSQLKQMVDQYGNYVIKFVQSKWANTYVNQDRLKISDKPALTWGTATYVTPLAFPLSSALYGRIGLVTEYDPAGWNIFDATIPSSYNVYLRWIQAQPVFPQLVSTVHSTFANHQLRDQFRKDFNIDCVLFHPDQEAEYHTNAAQHIWMAVTDWTTSHEIDTDMSTRFRRARFTVLIDEEFALNEGKWDLPVHKSARQIEVATEVLQAITKNNPVNVRGARSNPALPAEIAKVYNGGGYLHIYIEP